MVQKHPWSGVSLYEAITFSHGKLIKLFLSCSPLSCLFELTATHVIPVVDLSPQTLEEVSKE